MSFVRIINIAIIATALISSCSSKPGDERRAGVQAWKDKDFVSAISHLERAIEEDPKDQIAHQYMAICNEAVEQYAQAKKQFEWMAANAETKSERDIAKSSVQRLAAIAGPVRPRIVLFTAPWCHYAKRFEPVFNRVANDYKDKVDFVVIDIEKPERKAMREAYDLYFRRGYGSTGVPAFVFECKHGTVRADQFGELTEQEFRKLLPAYMDGAFAEKD